MQPFQLQTVKDMQNTVVNNNNNANDSL